MSCYATKLIHCTMINGVTYYINSVVKCGVGDRRSDSVFVDCDVLNGIDQFLNVVYHSNVKYYSIYLVNGLVYRFNRGFQRCEMPDVVSSYLESFVSGL